MELAEWAKCFNQTMMTCPRVKQARVVRAIFASVCYIRVRVWGHARDEELTREPKSLHNFESCMTCDK